MIFGSHVIVYTMAAFLLSSEANSETITIPITFNPLIQKAVVLGPTARLFYNRDKEFFSKFTVIDTAKNTEKHVKDIIQKTIRVAFLTTASSYLSGTLKLSDLRYIEGNKWSYNLSVQSILDASDGVISELSDTTVIYKIQESAMKVLERRYDFNIEAILNKLGLTKMEFYAVDENQWIDVVGFITNKVIKSRCETLNLTSCYLAEMINKTQQEIKSFTLDEVDSYLYNTSALVHALPAYRDAVLSSLYQTFDITALQLANMSDIDISAINTMNLTDVIQLFTRNVLKEFRLTESQIIQSDPIFVPEMLLSCRDKWEPFRSLVISKSFNTSAKDMSIASETLASLIEITYADLNQFTLNQMLLTLKTVIAPLKKDKEVLETSTLSDLVALYGSHSLNVKRESAFAAIETFTNLTKRQLTLLYGWNLQDYEFAEIFTLNDLNEVCWLNCDRYSLLTLTRISVGEVKPGFLCTSFKVLREIWKKKSVLHLEETFALGVDLSLDKPISKIVSSLTNASSSVNFRVFNITTKVQELIQKITFNNISAITTYSSSYLKTMSFQEIIALVVNLHQNGSIDHNVKVVSLTVMKSSISSPVLIPSNNISTVTEAQITKSAYLVRTSQIETVYQSNSYSFYQNAKTTSTSSYYQFYSGKPSLSIISTFTLAKATLAAIPRSSYRTKILSEQLSVTRSMDNISSTIKDLRLMHSSVSNTTTLRLDNFTIALSSSFISRFEMDQTNLQITASVLNIKKIISLSHVSTPTSSHYVVKNETNTKEDIPSFQPSKTSSTVSLYSPHFVVTNRVTSRLTTIVAPQITSYLTVMSQSSIYSSLKDLKTPEYVASTSFLQLHQNYTATSHSNINFPQTPLSQLNPSLPTSLQNLSATISFLDKDYISTVPQLNGYTPKIVKLTTLMSPFLTNIITSPTLTTSSFRNAITRNNISINKIQTNTTSVTNWTHPVVNTSMKNSSPTGSTVAYSDGESDMPRTVSPIRGLPTMISLVMQTTMVKNTIHSGTRSSTSTVTTPTTIMETTKLDVIYPSSPTTDRTVIKSSSSPFDISTPVVVLATQLRSSSAYLPNTTVSTLPMSSLPKFPSPTSQMMNATVSAQPTSFKSVTSSTSIIQSGICQSTSPCETGQECISKLGRCKAVKRLLGKFRITNGASFSPNLANKNSQTFLNFSRHLEELIDTVYGKTTYSNFYYESKVINFTEGSIIVFYKISWSTDLELSGDTLKRIRQGFVEEVNYVVEHQFVFDNKSISLQDFDECSSGITLTCHKTAHCNNTLGSYVCICPENSSGDGTTCQVIRSSKREDKDDVPWIIYVVITIMVVLVTFLIVVIIYCERKHKRKNRPQLDFTNNGINMYPRSTSYLAETPESEADLSDGLGIVNRHGPPPNMVTFNPSPEEKKELEIQNGLPGV